MLEVYLPLVALAAMAVGLGLLVLLLSFVIGPRSPNAVKQSPYECGLVPIGPAQRRVPVRFYLVGTLFILFDIEVVYLYPWAASYRRLIQPPPDGIGWSALAGMGLFLGVLLVGLLYVWRRGALDWR